MGESSDDLLRLLQESNAETDRIIAKMERGRAEAERVEGIAHNTPEILDDLDKAFCEKTGLTSTDVKFLFVAIGLQLARQYLVSNEKFRFDTAKQGDKLMKDALSIAPPDWKNVLLQSVPYDATKTGNLISVSTELSGATHRYRTLGHDPILGWIFGTANIMTNSLTKYNFETYQVKEMTIIRHYPLGVTGMMERAINYAVEKPILLASAVARQAVHFGSDYFTKQGLPLPLIATVNNDLAQNMLKKANIDMWSVTRGAVLANFINQLIGLIHGLFFTGGTDMERKLYEVRTRKILSYSNVVASSSNMLIVGLTRDFKKLDVGGIAVAIHRVITDKKFIRQVKYDFVFGSYRDMILRNCEI